MPWFWLCYENEIPKKAINGSHTIQLYSRSHVFYVYIDKKNREHIEYLTMKAEPVISILDKIAFTAFTCFSIFMILYILCPLKVRLSWYLRSYQSLKLAYLKIMETDITNFASKPR